MWLPDGLAGGIHCALPSSPLQFASRARRAQRAQHAHHFATISGPSSGEWNLHFQSPPRTARVAAATPVPRMPGSGRRGAEMRPMSPSQPLSRRSRRKHRRGRWRYSLIRAITRCPFEGRQSKRQSRLIELEQAIRSPAGNTIGGMPFLVIVRKCRQSSRQSLLESRSPAGARLHARANCRNQKFCASAESARRYGALVERSRIEQPLQSVWPERPDSAIRRTGWGRNRSAVDFRNCFGTSRPVSVLTIRRCHRHPDA